MHLISKVKQEAHIDGDVFRFEKGETIHTESSQNYDFDAFKIFTKEAGMQAHHSFTDASSDFAVLVLGWIQVLGSCHRLAFLF
jgi:uncharacterized SAM-dependent methyltransferase